MKAIEKWLLAFACLLSVAAASAHDASTNVANMETVSHLQADGVIELRRHVTSDGERAHFVKYFDAYFPEAFEQLGAMVFGQFTERGNPNHFTWLRGFKDISARPIVDAAFYYGPVWKEHRLKVNAILPDSNNVMLMRPLHAGQGLPVLPVLPAVDPVDESQGAQGVVVAQIFSVRKGCEVAFAKQAEQAFANYRIPGVRAAGVLVSLDVANNFPQLPIRTDGPFLVWIGVVRDDAVLKSQLVPRMVATEHSLDEGGLLRSTPERVVMDPTPRSRLRWLPGVMDATP